MAKRSMRLFWNWFRQKVLEKLALNSRIYAQDITAYLKSRQFFPTEFLNRQKYIDLRIL
jgi:hypothetical protein